MIRGSLVDVIVARNDVMFFGRGHFAALIAGFVAGALTLLFLTFPRRISAPHAVSFNHVAARTGSTASRPELPAPDRAIIASGFSGAACANHRDVSWLIYHFSDHKLVVVDHDDNERSRLRIPFATPNVGVETSAYLRFIVSNYESLPDRMVFIHGHRTSHHDSGDLAEVIRWLDWTKHYGSISHSGMIAFEPGADEYEDIRTVWPDLMEPWFGPIPAIVKGPLYAQFLVSRQRLHELPIEFWTNFEVFVHGPRPYQLGIDGSAMIIYEHLWPHILTGGWRHSADVQSPDPVSQVCAVLTWPGCRPHPDGASDGTGTGTGAAKPSLPDGSLIHPSIAALHNTRPIIVPTNWMRPPPRKQKDASGDGGGAACDKAA